MVDGPMIEVEHLTKDYGPIRALDDVSFHVKRGEIVGFLGPNGAGKTTCMKIITGYISATDGTVKIEGKDVVEHGVESRLNIGYLPENAPLYGDMTVREYLEFVGTVRGMEAQKLQEAVKRVAERVGVQERLGQEIGTLSKGFRQRVGLAQAMIHEPPILILDEPTSGLDPNQIVEIRELIRELGKDRTVILSTHNLPEVTATCNRIIIIHKGRIAADGTPEQIQAVHGGDNSFTLELVDVQEEEVSGGISSLKGVARVTKTSTPWATGVRFKVEAEGEEDLRPKLFALCVSKGWKLLELRRERLDLETIFQHITLA